MISEEMKCITEKITSDDVDNEKFDYDSIPEPNEAFLSLTINEKTPRSVYYSGKNIDENSKDNSITTITKTINDKIKQIKYEKLHWGQRKLLLSELEFLNSDYDKNEKTLIIYAGSARGTHLTFFFDIFPKIEWHLYDPNKFDYTLYNKKYRNIVKINYYYKINNINPTEPGYGFFTNEIAKYYTTDEYKIGNKYNRILFVSDIRIMPPDKDFSTREAKETYVKKFLVQVDEDMIYQENWVKIINPRAALLKFKLPYPFVGMSKCYKYLLGTIQIQAFGPVDTSESRLYVKNYNHKLIPKYYNLIRYDQRMAYINTFMRLHDFSETIVAPNVKLGDIWRDYAGIETIGLDCWIETMLIILMLEKFRNEKMLYILTKNNNLNLDLNNLISVNNVKMIIDFITKHLTTKNSREAFNIFLKKMV